MASLLLTQDTPPSDCSPTAALSVQYAGKASLVVPDSSNVTKSVHGTHFRCPAGRMNPKIAPVRTAMPKQPARTNKRLPRSFLSWKAEGIRTRSGQRFPSIRSRYRRRVRKAVRSEYRVHPQSGEGHGFKKELHDDVRATGAKSSAYSDFPGSFRDGRKHDVHDPYPTNQKRYPATSPIRATKVILAFSARPSVQAERSP